jgi:DNA-binding response OmpR family regulator
MLKKKIFIIEDDKIISDVLNDALVEAGFEVARAFDGEEGLALVESSQPDLLLLDILLPKMDGLTIAKKLKENSETTDIPIFILTVLEKNESVAEALQNGVYEYIVKTDFKVEDIVSRIKKKLEIV